MARPFGVTLINECVRDFFAYTDASFIGSRVPLNIPDNALGTTIGASGIAVRYEKAQAPETMCDIPFSMR